LKGITVEPEQAFQEPKRRLGFVRDLIAQQFDVFTFHAHSTGLLL
jgi:hypothetical protein